jgi:hypothetical protein
MFDRVEIERVVDMQQRSYRLLKWVASAVKQGFIFFETAHKYSTLPEAAEGWLKIHYLNLPPDARPRSDELGPFSAFFSTYLTNSFDLIANPGKRLYSPQAHCFCPICSWFVDAPNLQTKKITNSAKRQAETMKLNAIANLAAENRLAIREADVKKQLTDPQSSEDACLVAYGRDLLQRVQGIANGPAVLALWRGFAWTSSGSPKHRFQLTANLILDAEESLLAAIRKKATTGA